MSRSRATPEVVDRLIADLTAAALPEVTLEGGRCRGGVEVDRSAAVPWCVGSPRLQRWFGTDMNYPPRQGGRWTGWATCDRK